ncbi:hypothetical protein [Levilactobacillus spicheri]|uniref:HicB-like antitoxin of toxin-antitoxin system domain-containing protein n=2 Tax=Levilactobacillus spicheri TaxID=216463 RepID=A0A0F3RSA6_9LACO|nr:hypothetical protein [Levilactobacillus spicheri]KJW11677.1 hypothetical protein VC81_12870 [Levilactobacillus spicheri]KRL48254.1 hypothetical protein FD37_GL001381 [Levilactobacillus spicheri DSM 15429]GEO66529.1 hypothetical protein LSP04_09480 [Levilactobacillus spicheri]
MQAQMVTYPVILHPDNGEYNVEIPDINNDTWIRGTSAAQALILAKEVIGKTLAGLSELPPATPTNQLPVSDQDIQHLVTVDLSAFRLVEPAE